MRVTLLLCDAAQVAGNKLYILGGGWSVTGPDPSPSAIAMKIDVPWDQANEPHRWELAWLDADGTPVFIGDSPQAVVIENEFETGRPAGVAPGTPLEVAMAINLMPLPLEPGSRYVWQLTIDGQTHEDWQIGFSTRPRIV